MKRILLFLCCLIIVPVAVSQAENRLSPVTNVTLSYDLKKATLHIESLHPSNNWEIDYIRMMTVSLNNQSVSTLNYDHQTSAEGFSEDVPLKAQVGDVITVVLYSTQGNSMSKDMTVTSED